MPIPIIFASQAYDSSLDLKLTGASTKVIYLSQCAHLLKRAVRVERLALAVAIEANMP